MKSKKKKKSSKVLVADRDHRSARNLQSALCFRGYEVLTAKSKQDVLKKLDRHHIPIVIMDLELEDAEGLDVIQEIKVSFPSTDIIITSDDNDPDREGLVRDSDIFYYCLKPCDPRELEMAIRSSEQTKKEVDNNYTNIAVDY